MRFSGPKEIKFYVSQWIKNNAANLKGKLVIDLPAGNGVTSRELKDSGADVVAYDLIPEFFREKDIHCLYADLNESLAIDSNKADYVVCQEGIEHIADQVQLFNEFSRIMKVGAKLLITTPNYSNLRSRASYLLGESEYYGKFMPPNEIDSLWFSSQKSESVYYGHIFLIGIFKLRLFANLSGFKIHKIHFTRANDTSMLLLVLFYPFIVWFNWRAMKRAIRKSPENRVLWQELFKLAIEPKVLLDNNLFVEFEKVESAQESIAKFKQTHQAQAFIT
jgi:SAM-dependent methyltransferase